MNTDESNESDPFLTKLNTLNNCILMNKILLEVFQCLT